MQFPKQIMTPQEVKSSKLYKEIEKNLHNIPIIGVHDNDHRIYRTPTTKRQAIIYDLELEFGDILLFVEKGGNVARVVVDTQREKDKIIESISKDETAVNVSPATLGREVVRTIRREQKAEMKVKVSKADMNKLIDQLGDDEDQELTLSRLTALKQDLQKGSGKFIVLNKEGEFYGRNGWTKKQSEIVTFDDQESADDIKDNYKTVRI